MPITVSTVTPACSTLPLVDDVKTTSEERTKLAALFKDVPDADKPVAMQAAKRPDTIPLDKEISDDKNV